MPKKLEVAIGIMTDKQGRLLVGKRLRPPQAGKWEMPGGKVEAGETVIEALRREFREEGGVELTDIARWTKIETDATLLYLFRVYSQDFFIPTIYEEYRYIPADEIPSLDWIASNHGFVEDLRDILKSDPTILHHRFEPTNLDELETCLNHFSETWNARDHFATYVCDLQTDALLFPDDVSLSEKIASMHHEGLVITTSFPHQNALPTYIKYAERGQL